jgi:hypothetical protein
MTLFAVFPGMAKGNLPVMACAAEEPVFVVFFCDICCIYIELKSKLKVTYPACIFGTVKPVRERYRLDIVISRSAIDDYVPILFRRRKRP